MKTTGPELSDSVDLKLVECLFSQKNMLIVGGLGPGSAAMIGYFRTTQSWFLWWAAAATLLMVARLALNAAFFRRRDPAARPTEWRRRFLIATWANGALVGVAASYSILSADSLTQMLLITILMAFVMGSAACNGVYPQCAIGYVLFAELPLLITCLVTCELFYALYTVFIALLVASALGVVQGIYARSVGFLVSEEANAALVDQINRSNDELAAANKKLAAMAATDGLTGIANRRTFDETIRLETRAAQRDGSPLAVLMFDIDCFKAFNDQYGHQSGDMCLRRVAHVLAARSYRPRDLVARYGGEEFVALLPQTDVDGAIELAEVMRAAIESLDIKHAASTFGVVTVSVGVAPWRHDDAADSSLLVERADRALYLAKHSGRNRVRVAPESSSATPIAERVAH